jgi:hypothetical protein
MSGRRSHARFAVHLASEGSLRVFRDVHVQKTDDHEVIALTSDPVAVGQRLFIGTVGDHALVDEPVEVLESSPVPIDGGIRHRLRLRRLPKYLAPPGASAESRA